MVADCVRDRTLILLDFLQVDERIEWAAWEQSEHLPDIGHLEMMDRWFLHGSSLIS